jgi:hypothetical protein
MTGYHHSVNGMTWQAQNGDWFASSLAGANSATRTLLNAGEGIYPGSHTIGKPNGLSLRCLFP